MPVSSMKELLEAGVHFGHHTRKWNPKMKAYIYGERNDIYIIDLHKTRKKLEEAYEQVRQMAFNGENVSFRRHQKAGAGFSIQRGRRKLASQFYVNHRWLGGMLTNWPTIQTRIDRLNQLDRMVEDGTMDKLPKKESARLTGRAHQTRHDARRHPHHERPADLHLHRRLQERTHRDSRGASSGRSPSSRWWTPTAIPMKSTHVIPGNDDAIRAVKLMASQMAEAINEGRGMAQSAMEQRADAAMAGEAGGAVHIGEGGRIEYVGAPQISLPPVEHNAEDGESSTGSGEVDAQDAAMIGESSVDGVSGGAVVNGTQSMARTDAGGAGNDGENPSSGSNDGANSSTDALGQPAHDPALSGRRRERLTFKKSQK